MSTTLPCVVVARVAVAPVGALARPVVVAQLAARTHPRLRAVEVREPAAAADKPARVEAREVPVEAGSAAIAGQRASTPILCASPIFVCVS
jgi:hypothetical protein